MTEYIFDQHQHSLELDRLRLIEELFDPATISHIRTAGIRPGWKCLEVGAGAGSVLSWLEQAVGDAGVAYGVDRDIRHIRDLASSSVHVVEGDFLQVELDTPFDLAHCRFVLIHNQLSDEMLRKFWCELNPGGFLVVEEPDFTSALHLNSQAAEPVRLVSAAICRMFEDMELDPAFGLTLPGKLVDIGFQVVDVESRLHLARGGSPMARMMGLSADAVADRYIATGLVTREDIDRHIRDTHDENCWAVHYSTVSVVAQKPEIPGDVS